MVTAINDRDLRLQATSPRVIQNGSNYVLLNSTSQQFKYGSNNVSVQPTSILVNAILAGLLSGETITYTYSGFITTPTFSNGKLQILPNNIQGDVASITATVNYLGLVYEDTLTISKIYDQISASTDRKLDIATSDYVGTGYTLPSSANYLRLYSGASVITDGVTYGPATTTQNGLTVAVNTTTGQLTVSNTSTGSWSTNTENFTLTATKNSINYTTIYTVTKTRAGSPAATIDISGLTTFYKNSAGVISPSSVTLTASAQNITSPSYSWSVTYGTPATGSGSSITVTPSGAQNYVTVSLTVTGTNTSSITTTKTMAIVEQGVVGQTGQAGMMSAFPSIYQWLPTGSTPTNPTAGTYTWSTGAYSSTSSSSGTWYTQIPTTPGKGYTLYSITIPLTVTGTTTQSTLDWFNASIRAISITGTDGSTGGTGATGANGSGTYVITRPNTYYGSNSISADPTDDEVQAVVKRAKVAGDIVTITNGSNSRAVQWTGSIWAQQTTYITGSLIVEGTITASKITSGTFSTSTSYFTNIIGDSTYIDGLGGVWTIGMLHRRTASAPATSGPDFVSEDLSDTPGTYAAYFYSKYGGAAKFQASAGSGSNIVYIQGGKTDSIYLDGGFTNSGIRITTLPDSTRGGSDIYSNYGISISGMYYNQGLRVVNTYTGNCTAITAVNSGSGAAIQCQHTNPNTAALSAIGTIVATGNIIAYFSDDRLKTNLGLIPNALEKLNTLSGFYYEPNELAQQLGYQKRREIGVSAQQVQKILPEIIHKAPVDDKYLTVDYERLIPLIIEAIKELDRRTK
jgi:hypothetical protein